MKTIRLTFPNAQGHELSAKLELPVDSQAHNYAIFAHCFTCSKNLIAVGNISRALTQAGIAVLRFDFTGLGESAGNFGDTTFTTNVQDIVAAANFLGQHYKNPSLLVGHSLGGAAVLRAKKYLTDIKAVATLGAPYDPMHIEHLLEGNLEEVRRTGRGTVNIAGRRFQISRAFLEELEKDRPFDSIHHLGAALLVLHAPDDETVELENATQVFKAAQHPRSFVALDGADHLLTHKKDSAYAGEVIAGWASRYLEVPEKEQLPGTAQVVTRTSEGSYTTDVRAGKHHFTADEPESVGGNDFGPTPYGLLAAALGACTSMTLRMYADRKGWDLKEVQVHLNHKKDYPEDCQTCEGNSKAKIDHIERVIEMEGDLTEEQRQRLLEIADRCPVHRTLHSDVKIVTMMKEQSK